MDLPHAGTEWQSGREPRIVVGVSGSLGSIAALHRAVAEARSRAVEVLVVHAWEPPGGEFGYRRSPCPPLLDAVRSAALERLETVLDEAFAGVPTGVRMRAELVRGEPGRALTALADDPADLLVLGATQAGRLRRGMRPAVTAHCTARAVCPVLVVPKPELQRLMERRRSPWRPRTWDADPGRAALLAEGP
ncbi:universal stress protein [Kitasatospora sp. NPDC048365]|uniref:universal stress protein n=1 Tax=Kitasatospora sp. NPDC048365 TaxID=3364050 RepID=UPI00371E1516